MRYYPYGKTRHTWGSTPTDRRFTGQIEDAEIGLYFYNARYYDAALGRFVQADSIVPAPGNPQSLNRYAYVLNNPLRYTDPSGHFPLAIPALALAGGLLTTGTYLLTVQPQDFNWGDLGTVAAAGAAGGALIGTGVAAGAGIAMIAGVTGAGIGTAGVAAAAVGAAGVGAVISAETYMFTTAAKGETFDRKDFCIESTIGAAEAGLSSITGGVSSVGISGGMAALGSIWKDAAHGRSIDYEQAAIQGAWGLGSGLVAESFTGGFSSPTHMTREGFVDFTAAAFPDALVRQTRRLEASMLRASARTIIRDSLYGIGSNIIQDKLSQ